GAPCSSNLRRPTLGFGTVGEIESVFVKLFSAVKYNSNCLGLTDQLVGKWTETVLRETFGSLLRKVTDICLGLLSVNSNISSDKEAVMEGNTAKSRQTAPWTGPTDRHFTFRTTCKLSPPMLNTISNCGCRALGGLPPSLRDNW